MHCEIIRLNSEIFGVLFMERYMTPVLCTIFNISRKCVTGCYGIREGPLKKKYFFDYSVTELECCVAFLKKRWRFLKFTVAFTKNVRSRSKNKIFFQIGKFSESSVKILIFFKLISSISTFVVGISATLLHVLSCSCSSLLCFL